MNYLAHSLLAHPNPAHIAGNYLADYVHGNKAVEAYPLELQQGIRMHRAIDSFTDSHPIVLEGKKLLHPKQGKFAGPVLDVFYDHLLSIHWSKFTDVPLEILAKEVYDAMKQYERYFPEKGWKRLSMMIAHNWIVGYHKREALIYTYQRMSEKLTFENRIPFAADDTYEHFEVLEQGFLDFFPDLQTRIKGQLKIEN